MKKANVWRNAGIATALLLFGSANIPEVTHADYSVTVDPGIRYQTLEGWGTSLAWWANVIGSQPNMTIRNDYADKIFNASTGLGLTVARYNIGGGENPSYLPPSSTVYISPRTRVPGYKATSTSAYDWTQDAGQRWMLQAGIDRGVNLTEAFSNSPPYWMTNSGSVSGADDGGQDNLNPAYYDAFSDYLTTVVQHFKDSWGVTFDTLEPFNEPVSSWWRKGNWQEGAHIGNATQNTMIKKVGASLNAKGLTTKLASADDNSIDEAIDTFNSYDSTAKGYVSQINTHSYGGSNRTGLLNLAKTNNKKLWMTEYGDGDSSGMTLASTILSDMRNMQPTVWTYWQPVDYDGWGLMVSDLDNPTNYSYALSEKYYVMGNFSKFIRPGAQFVAINDGNSVAAYDSASNKLTIVTQNNSSADTNVTYDLSKFTSITGSATPYRTSSTENLAQLSAIGTAGKTFTAVSKAKSVTTFVINGVTAPAALSNSLTNTGFETGSLSSWASTGNAGVETAHPHAGTHDAYLNNGGAISQQFVVPTSGSYTMTAYAAISNGSGSIGVDLNGLQIVNKTVTGTAYAPYTATFSANAGDVVNIWAYSPSSTASMTVDDVTVAPAVVTSLQNAGFETGLIGPWITAGVAGVESNYPHTGSYDGYLHTGGSMSQSFTAPTSGTYTFTAYAAISNGSGSVGIDRNGTQVVNKTVTGGGYAPYTGTFTANAGDTINVWAWSPSAATWMTIDDVTVTQ